MAGNQGPSRPNMFTLQSQQSISDKTAEKRKHLKQLEIDFETTKSSIPFSNNALAFPTLLSQPDNSIVVNSDIILPPSHRTKQLYFPPNLPSDLSTVASDKCNKDSSRLKMCQSIQSSGKLKLAADVIYDFTSEDMQDCGEIGRGGFGTVNKMIHRKSDTVMAVKRIRSTVEEKEQRQLLMDLDVVMKSNECPYIVQFYGALFKEGDCWICMELMDTSLDKFYKFIYERLHQRIPEVIIGKVTVATVKALNYLKEELKIIHRDVKPSNILLDRRGAIKLCDFGISGQLVDSIAKTRDAGCRPYMAPERIDPQRARGYDVRSDVWSLGITLVEVATGKFPYPRWNSVFEQLCQVVQGPPPQLSNSSNAVFSPEFIGFVNTCLIKEEKDRPKYGALLQHEFIVNSDEEDVDIGKYMSEMIDTMHSTGRTLTLHE
uniref:mitogen-activated protein kinase kinase n=2 Tax=Cacopsylla melanoneura TaxID=428564 RepID=A0A8D8WY37_9HEMI